MVFVPFLTYFVRSCNILSCFFEHRAHFCLITFEIKLTSAAEVSDEPKILQILQYYIKALHMKEYSQFRDTELWRDGEQVREQGSEKANEEQQEERERARGAEDGPNERASEEVRERGRTEWLSEGTTGRGWMV